MGAGTDDAVTTPSALKARAAAAKQEAKELKAKARAKEEKANAKQQVRGSASPRRPLSFSFVVDGRVNV